MVAKKLPSKEYLEECFHYEGDSGLVYWKSRPRSHFNSDKGWKISQKSAIGIAGNTEQRGYRVVNLNGNVLKVHRIVFKMLYNEEPDFVDHVDGDRMNNKKDNLRAATFKINARNVAKTTQISNTSINGVYLREDGSSPRYIAAWRNLEGGQCSQSFSIKTYGDSLAFRLACEHRAKMIDLLNEAGAGYTERHGT